MIAEKRFLFFGVLLFVFITLHWKGTGYFDYEGYDIDLSFHLANNFGYFILFPLIRDFINLISFGNALFILPILFGTVTYYVLVAWLNEKKVSMFVLGCFLFLFFRFQQFIFSFSRDSLIIMLSVVFFYFLEKWHNDNSKKHLIYCLIILGLALISKMTGILLLIIFLFIILDRKKPLYAWLFLVFIAITAFLTGITSINISTFLFYYWPFFFVFVFIKPKKFLWKLNMVVLFLILLVSLKTGFFNEGWNLFWSTAYRYFAIFYFPLFLWISEEIEELKSEFKRVCNIFSHSFTHVFIWL